MHYRRLGVLILVVGLQGSAAAQSWPSKPIRAIVPFTAGSASDIIARTAMEQLSITYASGGIGSTTHLNAERTRSSPANSCRARS
jgi:hypothetical protein